MTHSLYRQWLREMKSPELVSIVNTSLERFRFTINRLGSKEMFQAMARMTDDSYWNLMSFSFIAGRPFDNAEYQSGMQVAVLSENMAKTLFHEDEPVGSTVEIGNLPYRIVGVVKDVTSIFDAAVGDVWVPFSSLDTYERLPAAVMLLANSKEDFPAIIDEVRDIEKKYDIQNHPWTWHLSGPQPRKLYMLEIHGSSVEEEQQMARSESRKTILLIILFLLIPAINLTAFSLAQIKKRISEIGIRKAFGARRRNVLFQVLCENMLTSLIGGLIGLFCSYFTILGFRHWLLGIPANSLIPGNTMVSFSIFMVVFILCLVINLLSAGLPAYRASRMKIVDSINSNDI